MSYAPNNPDIRIGDTWEYSDGERVHAFMLQCQQAGRPDAGKQAGAVGHAVSEDLLRWEPCPAAIVPGDKGSYDDQDIWTGCTIREKDKSYLFYTSRKGAAGDASISVAVSSDDLTFEKSKNNPLFVPDGRYYDCPEKPCRFSMHGHPKGNDGYDCRDLCVVKDPSGEFWWGFFAARRPADTCVETSVIGLAKSYDLIHWEQLPPCFCPDRYACLETPDVFYMDGKWYMICLAGNVYGQRRSAKDELPFPLISIYATADRPEGPYTEPDNNLLVSTMAMSGNCAKTVLHKGERYLFYLEVMDKGNWVFETSMSTPKLLKFDENGDLRPYFYSGICAYYDKPYLPQQTDFLPADGRWGSNGQWKAADNTIKGCCKKDWCIQPFAKQQKDFVMEADISAPDAATAGFVFGLGETVTERGFALYLDYEQNRVFLTKARTYEIFDGRSVPLCREKMHLMLYCYGYVIEAFLNGKLLFHFLCERGPGYVGCLVEQGNACFDNLTIHPLKPYDGENL